MTARSINDNVLRILTSFPEAVGRPPFRSGGWYDKVGNAYFLHSPREAKRRPGQLVELLKVAPSQPQNARRSAVHGRLRDMHTPELAAPQPSPSQMPL